MKKRGISLTTMSIMILIMLILVSTISISITYSITNAKKLVFAKEIYNIQNIVSEYVKREQTLPDTSEVITITPTDVTQFEGETFVDSKLNLNVIVLTELDIKNTNYGNKTIGDNEQEKSKDVYAVSQATGKVYYIAGFESDGQKYYTLTEELRNMIEKKQNINIGEKTITFTPSKIGWAKEGVSVTVFVPSEFTAPSITISNTNIAYTESSTTDGVLYIVNSSKVAEDFVITVSYTKNGTSSSVTYEAKLDKIAPLISKDANIANTSTHINGLNATDDKSGIKYFKYAEGIINDANLQEYMHAYGKKINKGSINMKNKTVYTLYAEDKSGNYTVLHLDGDGERFYPTMVTTQGINRLKLINSYNLNLIDMKIIGNSVQNGTPEIEAPAEIQSVGELVTDETDLNYGKYKIPITLARKNLINYPYATQSKTGWEVSDDGSIKVDIETVENQYRTFDLKYSSTLKAGTYTFSIGNPNIILVFYYKDSNGEQKWITFHDNQTFTINSDLVYEKMYLQINPNISLHQAVYPQLEEGTTSTEYELYTEPKTYNIYLEEPLRKVENTYDYINLKTGEVVRKISTVTYDGSSDEIWSTYGAQESTNRVYNGYAIANHLASNVLAKQCLCNRLVSLREYGKIWYGTDLACFLGNVNQNVTRFVVTSEKTSIAEFRTELSNYPLEVTFILSEEEWKTEKINVSEMPLNYGTNIITVDTTVFPYQTVVTYYAKQ